jgi:hypothetical protein
MAVAARAGEKAPTGVELVYQTGHGAGRKGTERTGTLVHDQIGPKMVPL